MACTSARDASPTMPKIAPIKGFRSAVQWLDAPGSPATPGRGGGGAGLITMIRGFVHQMTIAKSERSGLSQDLDDHALPALSVPFPVEHPLPGTQVQPASCDRHDNFMAYRQTPQVGRRVVLPGVVVPVAG